VLAEFLSLVQWLAVGCVVAASVGSTRSSVQASAEPPPN
jgi:threonine/homoserine efflux transporter RhtA